MAADGSTTVEDVIPLHAELGPAAFQPYVLGLADLGYGNVGSEDVKSSLAFVVMMRRGGALLALPDTALPDEDLEIGVHATPEDLIGPNLKAVLGAALMDEDSLLQEPTVIAGKDVPVLLVDFSSAVLPFLKPVDIVEDMANVLCFDVIEPMVIPNPEALITQAVSWSSGSQPDQQAERLHFYSADEVPETPRETPVVPSPTPKRRSTTARHGGDASSPKQPAAVKKRVTVASLAESLDVINQTLPAMIAQMEQLSTRTAAIESATSKPADRASALRQPVGRLPTPGSPSAVNGLIKEMPPPKTSAAALKPRVQFTEGETGEMAEDMIPTGSTDYAQAMLAQSKALTALVAQIASNSGDPFQDLSSSSSGMSSKGSAGRARLQAELAAHRGTFFTSVLQSMSRRMFPAQPAEVEMSVLRDRGCTPTQYLERFGGYGKTRDIGFIAWQVALCMNHLQEGNTLAAMDSLSLLFVCLEQTSLDGGKMEVGLLLALVEDPPQALFSGRSLALAANPKPFAPTANQRWVTTALQYLKEMDVITTRRAEVTAPAKNPDPTNPNGPSPKKKGKGKGGAKAKAAAAATHEEEA